MKTKLPAVTGKHFYDLISLQLSRKHRKIKKVQYRNAHSWFLSTSTLLSITIMRQWNEHRFGHFTTAIKCETETIDPNRIFSPP